jgi:acetylornithine deacetylase
MQSEEQLLKQLMDIPSPSGQEVAVGEFIFDFLTKTGFSPEKFPVAENRFNIIAKLGEPRVYLSAHMDTVAPFIQYSADSDHIYGRGSCDTKGSLACMLTAAVAAKNSGISNFGLIFTVGEEVDLIGARTMIKSYPDLPFVVVGEPTSLEIVNAHFGILVVKISAAGKAAHSSRPEQGINAIDLLMETIQKIKAMPVFPETLMSLVQIQGGIADNIIPANANAVFSFRVSPKDSLDYVSQMKALCSPSVQLEVEQAVASINCEVPPALQFIKSVKSVKYLTELSFFKRGVVLGPGDIQYAHGQDEMVPRAELAKAVEIYTQILNNFYRSTSNP